MQYLSRDWTRQGEQEVTEYTNTHIAEVIDEYIHDEKHRKIMKRRLIDGITFEPLAEEFGLSVRWVKHIVYKCSKIVFKHL